jgi:hypothetical protein
MTNDLLGGTRILALDYPPAVTVYDATIIANATITTTYAAGTPEVGVTFMAPTTGRVVLTTGGGVRNNAANNDRVFIAPQIYLGTSSAGTEILAPTAPQYGISSGGGYTTDDYQWLSRTSLIAGLVPGSTYYVRTMHAQVNNSGATSGTSDLFGRSLVVAPAS